MADIQNNTRYYSKTGDTASISESLKLEGCVGHGGSFTTEVRRVLFDISIRLYQSSFDLYHHSLGTPVGGQFLMYIRALRATLNKTDRSFNSVSLYKSASYMSFVIPAWLTVSRCSLLAVTPSQSQPIYSPRLGGRVLRSLGLLSTQLCPFSPTLTLLETG